MTLFEQYGVCVYYSILLIIGTDIAPINTVQTIYSAIVVVFGALFCAFIFGNMASLLSAMNKKEQIFQQELDMAGSTMRALKLPEELQDEIIKYITYINETPEA